MNDARDVGRTFWEKHGASLAAIAAAVIAVCGAIIAALISKNVITINVGTPAPKSQSSAASSSSTSSSHSATTTAAPPSTSSTAPKVDPLKGPFDCAALKKESPTVRNCGDFVLPMFQAIDLDSKDSNWGMGGPSGASLSFNSGVTLQNQGRDQTPGISTVKSVRPSYSSCANMTKTDYVNSIDVHDLNANTMFCAKTPLGRYSEVRILRDVIQADKIYLSIITWEKQL